MKCNKTCMFCEEPKIFFINQSNFHGTCLQHCNFSSFFYRCLHCESTAPIIARNCETCKIQSYLLSVHPLTDSYVPSNEDSLMLNLKKVNCKTLQCSNCIKFHLDSCRICSPSSFICPVCNSQKIRSQDLPCNHSICAECLQYYQHCVECEQNKPKSFCQICFSHENVSLMSECGRHLLCINCFTKSSYKCTACLGTFNCQDCLNEKYFRVDLECEHLVCIECEKSHVCYKCQVCSNRKDVFLMDSCQHLVCKTCYEKSYKLCTVCVGEFLCQTCNLTGFFRSTLGCGHVACLDCAPNHQCFRCEVCSSDKNVKLRDSCKTHHVCKKCFNKSSQKCTVCVGTLQCPSCNLVKYFPNQMSCGHVVCSDCSSFHSCFICESCGVLKDYQLPETCEKHKICKECYEEAESTCVKCLKPFTCKRCKHQRYKRANCSHEFCFKCSGAFLCPFCQEEALKNKPKVQKHDPPEENVQSSAKLPLRQSIKSEEESFKIILNDSKLDEAEDANDQTNYIEKDHKSNQIVSVPALEKANQDKVNMGVIEIGVNEEESPLLGQKPRPSNKRKDLCSCSHQLVILIIFYIMTFLCCCGWFCNFCFGFSSKVYKERFKDFFCFCFCAPKGLYRKIWKHLVRFRWAR